MRLADVKRRFFPRTLRAAPAGSAEDFLGPELVKLDSGIGMFRLVHLLDALETTRGVETILSMGCGSGLHEAFLAAESPGRRVVGADLVEPGRLPELRNLSFQRGNFLDPAFRASLEPADFVYSIECLEHVADDSVVFDALAEKVRPGGHLYIQVPFASEKEQADPELCRGEKERFEHERPGYSADQLRSHCERRNLRVLAVAGAFWCPLQPMVWFASERFGAEGLSRYWRDVFAIASLDVRAGIPSNRGEAIAIKVFASKES